MFNMWPWPPALARLATLTAVAAALLLACGDDSAPAPKPGAIDPALSTVSVSRASGVLSNGTDRVVIEVRVRDANGLALPGVSVNLVASGRGNILTQPVAPTNEFGVATGSLASTVAEKKTVSASVGPEGIALEQRPSVEYVAWAPPAVSLAFQTGPSDVAAGADIAPAIQVVFEDASGKVAATESSPITVALGENPGEATLGGTLTVAAVGGVATFSDLKIDRPGAGYTLVAAADGMAPRTSAAFAVTTGKPASLEVSQAPATVVAGEPLAFTLTVRDGSGNVVEGYAGTLRFGADDPSAHLPEDYRFTAEDGGTKVFESTLFKAGVRTLSVTDDEGGLGAEHTVEVVAAPAAALLLTGIGTELVAGTRASAIVSVVDAFGNGVVGYAGAVAFGSTDPHALLPEEYAFGPEDEGVHVFENGIELRSAGLQDVTVSDVDDAGLNGTQVAISVLAAAPQGLVFSVEPSDVRVREVMAPAVVVAVSDAFGNVVAAANDTISLTLGDNPGDATLNGPVSVAAEAGVALFGGLSIEAEGLGYTLEAATDSLNPATSAAFDVFDDVAPGATRLHVAGKGESNVRLAWTATGDDGAFGKASSYELRYSTSPLDAGTFAAAIAVAIGAPAEPGTTETAEVLGLTAGMTYYFGLKVVDGAGNASLEVVSEAPGCPQPFTGLDCGDCAPGYEPDGQGGCVEAAVCEPNPCTAAPDPSCNDGSTLSSYPNPGVCSAQGEAFECTYEPVQTDCTFNGQICLDGACVDDPCSPSPCIPESPACDNATTAVVYEATCEVAGPGTPACVQISTTVDCASGGEICVEGTCAPAGTPVRGDLLITELMHSPTSGADAERWFEMRNISGLWLDIGGISIEETTAGRSFSLPGSAIALEPGAFYVFGGSTRAEFDYAWDSGSFALGSTGNLRLSVGGAIVEELAWDARFPQHTGKAMNLSSLMSGAQANRAPWYWCDASVPMAGGDSGTPGFENGDCGLLAPSEPIDWCQLQYPQDAGTVAADEVVIVYSRVYEPGATDLNQAGNDLYPWLEAEVGWGAGDDATTWTQWSRADYNPGYDVASPSFMPNNDELRGELSISVPGDYKFGYRYRLFEPVTGSWSSYTYCDTAGVAGAAPSWGTMTVVSRTPNAAL